MNPRRAGSAFTLIELLVALAVTAVLAATMLSVTSGLLRIWQRTQDRFTAETQAKLVLDHVERDLHAAIIRGDGPAWLAADMINSPGALVNHGWLTNARSKPPGADSERAAPVTAGGVTSSIADARFGVSGVWLRWLTTNTETAGSLPVAVAYQVARRPVSGPVTAASAAAVRYSLFRSAVAPETTLAVGLDVEAAGYASSSASPGAVRTASTLTNPITSGDLIATNVVDFGVWIYALEPAGNWRLLFPQNPGDRSYVASGGTTVPAAAEVMVRILSEQGATLLAGMEGGGGQRPEAFSTDAAWWWSVVEANSVVVTRRVAVRGALP